MRGLEYTFPGFRGTGAREDALAILTNNLCLMMIISLIIIINKTMLRLINYFLVSLLSVY